MKKFIEFHLIQNFAPSNLNRDDTGSPKEAFFGGVRRARVSSQCFKRAIRKDDRYAALVSEEHRAIRTRKLQQEIINRLSARDAAGVAEKVEGALAAGDLKLKKKKGEDRGNTKYLIFLGEKEISKLADLIEKNWDAPDFEWAKDFVKSLDGGQSVDVALFGRMLANLPKANRDAACQVAHAISTHRVDREFDYYTAVDDYAAPEDRAEEDKDTGAGMIGLVEFNAATFYRYAVIDVAKLYENLQKDRDLTLAAVEAFCEGIARAIPTGKQNSFAAHNPPDFIGVSVREGGPLNLANAFETPVWAKNEGALTERSVQALSEYEQRLSAAYGSEKDAWFCLDLTGSWPTTKGEAHASLKALSARVRKEAATILGGGALE